MRGLKPQPSLNSFQDDVNRNQIEFASCKTSYSMPLAWRLAALARRRCQVTTPTWQIRHRFTSLVPPIVEGILQFSALL